MNDYSNFKLFLVVLFALLGAVVFLSDPFANKIYTSTGNETSSSVVSSVSDGTVIIEAEEVALGVPGVSNANSHWIYVAIAVTVVNLAGAVSIVVMTNKEDTSRI